MRPASSISPKMLPVWGPTLLGVGVFAGYCVLSWLGNLSFALMSLMVFAGLLFPLVWGWRQKNWAEMGFVWPVTGSAWGWGLAVGLFTAVIGSAAIGFVRVPTNVAVELAIGVPMWLLLASPFQEFFFRGWLQPTLERGLGQWGGLLLTTVLFTAWHYVAPFSGSSVPLYSLLGLVSTFAAGLLYGLSFQRTGHIWTPWLAHAIAGIWFVFSGAMPFTTAMGL